MAVISQKELIRIVREHQEQNDIVVMTNGCFDFAHPGHVSFLEKSSKIGDVLVVALNSDASIRRIKGPSRPIVNLDHRALVINALRCVDYVVSFDDDSPKKLYSEVLPDIIVKGVDYSENDVDGGEAVKNSGGQVIIVDSMIDWSTSKIEDITRDG